MVDMVSFQDCSRPISDTELSSKHGKEENSMCDLIAFLTIAQKLGIDVLSIDSRSIGALAGKGGTSRVTQRQMDVQTSFAFKYFSSKQRLEFQRGKLSEAEVFQTLINEISVLAHPKVRWHANIVELQGVCWDIPADYEVWPILVFEKSQHGDLFNFLHSPIGRDISFTQRLELCIDVGTAIIDMHSLGIIHGDVKPNNVLVFSDSQNATTFFAKVIDFGYSSQFSHEEDKILMPKSPPWHAPEYRGACTPAESRKMDIFSFGMLCLWILFEKYLSQVIPLPAEVAWAREYFPKAKQNDFTSIFLARLKSENKLSSLANQLLLHAPEFSVEKQNSLQQFFRASLQNDPFKRASEMTKCFGSFCTQAFPRTWEYYEADADASDPPKIVVSKLPRKLKVKKRLVIRKDYFQILHLKIPLYESDFRVRRKVRLLLERRAQPKFNWLHSTPSQRNDSDNNLTFQLAICYQLGFGGKKDIRMSQQLLNDIEKSEDELDETIRQIHSWNYSQPRQDVAHGRLLADGSIFEQNLTEEYSMSGKLTEAENQIRQEISNLEDWSLKRSVIKTTLCKALGLILFAQLRWNEAEMQFLQVLEVHKALGLNRTDILRSMEDLSSTYQKQSRWELAKELDMQALRIREEAFGTSHLSTLASMAGLALGYKEQGQTNQAEGLEVQVVEIRKKRLGAEHPETLNSMSNLASTYRSQGRLKQAEELNIQVKNTRTRLLGAEHPSTLTSVNNLAMTFFSQGRYDEAEQLLTHAVEASKRVQGKEDPETLVCMGNLAQTYAAQGRLDLAEKLDTQVLDIRKIVLGQEHLDTLVSMGNLASTYEAQDRWDQAEKLQLQIVETTERIHGADHPDTLTRTGNLAVTYSRQGRQNEAEKLKARVLEASKRVLGLEHPDTLTCMSNLASIYTQQGRKKEAEDLEAQVAEISKRVVSLDHPDVARR